MSNPATGPAWFEFGRTVLVRAVAALPADAARTGGDDADDDRADGDADLSTTRAALLLDSAFSVLAANASMSPSESEVLALAATVEADVQCRRLLARLQGANTDGRLTLGAIALLLGGEHTGALTLSTGAALRRCAFVDIVAEGPWADHIVAVHPGVIWALLGDVSPDPELPPDTTQYETTVTDAGDSELVVVNGTDRMRRREAGAARAIGRRFICIAAPDDDRSWAALVREATITGSGLIVEIGDELNAATRRWLNRATHLSWVLSAPSGPAVEELPDRTWAEVQAPADDPTDAEWLATFGADVDRSHHLTFDQMHRVAGVRDAVGGDLDAAVRRLASGRLERFTRRIAPTRTWDDIVLSPDRTELLHSVVERYLHASQVYDAWGFTPTPSRGIVALFSGPSGTGKTLAAEVIAGTLGLDVFKLDLSSVVSKYIGETEKNLEQVFDAASAGNMVLFFDEADSLFGKRSEVKDARDRYANIEVSYLLQRLEAYDGLVVMATNFEKNVDEAFLRRIHVRVEFNLPGLDERVTIWNRNLPPDAPVDGVDVEWLAEHFELSGGSIRNAAVHAGFTAAAAGTPITMECAVTGVAREYRKLGRLLKEKDFGEYIGLLTG